MRLLRFTPDGTLINETPIVPELHGRFGRLRTPMMGPDGALYVTTSNAVSFAGSPPYADRILRVFVQTPGSAPGAPSELSATVGDGRITLTWSAPSDGGSRIIRYEYRYAVSGGALRRVVDRTRRRRRDERHHRRSHQRHGISIRGAGG